MIEKLVGYMLDLEAVHSTSSLTNGVSIMIELIRKNNSDYDFEPVVHQTLQSHPPSNKDPVYLGYMLRIFASRIKDFQHLFNNPKSFKGNIKSTFGDIEPLGFERFRICELYAELLHCSNIALLNDPRGDSVVKQRDAKREENVQRVEETKGIGRREDSDTTDVGISSPEADTFAPSTTQEMNSAEDSVVAIEVIKTGEPQNQPSPEESGPLHLQQQVFDYPPPNGVTDSNDIVVGDYLKMQFVEHRVLPDTIDLFFRFPWNNFLHNVIYDILQQVFHGSMEHGYNRHLASDAFINGQLVSRIIQSQTMADVTDSGSKTVRLGYMGHLTLIAEEVLKLPDRVSLRQLHPYVLEQLCTKEWAEYVDQVLVVTKTRDNAILGGVRPPVVQIPIANMALNPGQVSIDGQPIGNVLAVDELAQNTPDHYVGGQMSFVDGDMARSYPKATNPDDDDEDSDDEDDDEDDDDEGNLRDYRNGPDQEVDPANQHVRLLELRCILI